MSLVSDEFVKETEVVFESRVGGQCGGLKTSSVVENVFSSYLQQKTVFKNRTLLMNEHFPDDVIHRDREVKMISSVLAPVLRGYKPSNIFIYGSIGTGKTVTIKYILGQLERVSGENQKNIYINCKMKKVSDTEYRVLAQILKELGVAVPETGISTNNLYKKFFDVVEKKNIIIVLDEIDVLVNKIGDSVLYNLSRSGMNITLIGITNNLMFSEKIDPRTRSSLAEEEIVFKPYNAVEIKDILLSRIGEAFSVPVDESVLNKCSAIAAQEHGDARRAIDLLRVSAEVCERMGGTSIQEKHVDMANEMINLDRVVEIVKGQPKQSQFVLASILKLRKANEKSGWKDTRIFTGDVYNSYKRICEESGIKTLTQRRVCDLINEFEMFGIIETKVSSRGRYGKLREIDILVNDEIIGKMENILSGALV